MRDKLKAYTPGAFYRRWETWLKPSFVSAVLVFGVFVGICGLLVWLGEPATEDGGSNLGSVLEAQAAMTAIFLAAMVFIVEAVQRREGLDDPLYELFLSESWARWIFATAVWLLIGTALLYAVGPITGLIGELADARGDALGISSLVVAAVFVLAFLLRALHVLRPEQYRELRRKAVFDQVRCGAQSQARSRSQASKSSHELIRQFAGSLNEPETQATRAIERVVDHTHQAVERAQLTEIREGMELLECICSTILQDLKESESEAPEINSVDDGRWFGHDNILSGLQRLLRTAANSAASESVLWAIFRADVQKAQSFLGTPYRLGENIESGNDLFVQVMLECVQSDTQPFTKLPTTEMSFRYRTPQEEMLSEALRNALSRSKGTSDNSRECQLARRVVAFVHDVAGRVALGNDEKRSCAFLQCLLQQTEDTNLASNEMPEVSNGLRRTLRQATMSAIGYGVGVANHTFLDTAARRLNIDELAKAEEAGHVYALIDQDLSKWNGGESILRGGLLWLSSRMHSQPPPIETEEDLHQRHAEGIILGYMWLLGMVHNGTGELELPDTVRSEFDRVWRLHGARLVAALSRAGVSGGGDLWRWSEAAYGGGGGDDQ